ncbi:MAG: hypothetical protein U1E65_36435 [Myxococcota bacterium]
MRTRCVALGLAWGLLGCTSGDPLFIAPPFESTDNLLGYQEGPGDYTLFRETPGNAAFLALSDFPVALVGYAYPRPLAGLGGGELTGQERGRCELLDYSQFATRTVLNAKGEGADWVLRSGPDEEADHVLQGEQLIRCIGSCTEWEQEPPIEILDRITFAAVRDGSAVLGGSSGGLLRFSPDGSYAPICSAFSPSPVIISGTWDGLDSVWLGLEHGEIRELKLEEQRVGTPCITRTVTHTPDRRTVSGLDVAPASSPEQPPFELFALTGTVGTPARLLRWDGAKMTPIVEAPRLVGIADVRWVAPGRAVAVVGGAQFLVIDGMTARLLRLPVEPSPIRNYAAESLDVEGPTAVWIGIAHAGPARFSLSDQSWKLPSTIDDGPYGLRGLARFRDRTYYLGPNAGLAEVPDRGPPCKGTTTLQHGTDGISTGLMRRLNDDHLIVADAVEGAAPERHSVRMLKRTSGGTP